MIKKTGVIKKRYRTKNILLVVGILFIAANLRMSLSSVGPLVGMIRDDTGISNGAAGLLTTLPLLSFAIFSILASNIARRYGIKSTLMASLVALVIGIFLRSVYTAFALFAGTFILGSAIAMGNVLLPALIKRRFPHRIGIMTGLYTTFMNLFGALASGLSVPIAQQLGVGWRRTLASTALLVIITIILWLPQMFDRRSSKRYEVTQKVNIWGSPLAWFVTLFLGLQSMLYFVMLSWLPEIFIHYGMNSSKAGFMLSLMLLSSIPANFIVPIIADRIKKQHILIITVVSITLLGLVGIFLSGQFLAPLWTILLGLGIGGCLSLSLALIALRTLDTQHTSQLSGMAQSVGYLLAAIGPVLFGALRDATHTWTMPLIIMMVTCIVLFIVGIGAGKDAYVQSKKLGESQITS